MPNSIVPEGLEGYIEDWKMSPGLEHNNHTKAKGASDPRRPRNDSRNNADTAPICTRGSIAGPRPDL